MSEGLDMVFHVAWTKGHFSVTSVGKNFIRVWSLPERVPKWPMSPEGPPHCPRAPGLPLAHSSLCIHFASFLMDSPIFLHLLHHWWSGGVQPRYFLQAIRRWLFKCLHRADVPITLPSPSLQWPETFSAPENTWCSCCAFDQESTSGNKRIPRWRLFGRRAPGCVCSSSLSSHFSCEQMFSTGWVAMLCLVPYTNASSHSPASG